VRAEHLACASVRDRDFSHMGEIEVSGRMLSRSSLLLSNDVEKIGVRARRRRRPVQRALARDGGVLDYCSRTASTPIAT